MEDMWHTMRYDVKTQELIDDNDYSRVGYFIRKYKGPTELVLLATDGLLDDFFGSWASPDADNNEDHFDADHEWNRLLDIW